MYQPSVIMKETQDVNKESDLFFHLQADSIKKSLWFFIIFSTDYCEAHANNKRLKYKSKTCHKRSTANKLVNNSCRICTVMLFETK